MATKKPAAIVKSAPAPIVAAKKMTPMERHTKALAKKAKRLADAPMTPKGTARAKRRGSMQHWLVDLKTRSAILASYGAKDEGKFLKYAPSAQAALAMCGIVATTEEKEMAKTIKHELGLDVKKPRAKIVQDAQHEAIERSSVAKGDGINTMEKVKPLKSVPTAKKVTAKKSEPALKVMTEKQMANLIKSNAGMESIAA